MSQVEHIGLLLKDLETVLKAGGYWSSTAPAPEALQSTQPFARDTLAFEAWLQFIFIQVAIFIILRNLDIPLHTIS